MVNTYRIARALAAMPPPRRHERVRATGTRKPQATLAHRCQKRTFSPRPSGFLLTARAVPHHVPNEGKDSEAARHVQRGRPR